MRRRQIKRVWRESVSSTKQSRGERARCVCVCWGQSKEHKERMTSSHGVQAARKERARQKPRPPLFASAAEDRRGVPAQRGCGAKRPPRRRSSTSHPNETAAQRKSKRAGRAAAPLHPLRRPKSCHTGPSSPKRAPRRQPHAAQSWHFVPSRRHREPPSHPDRWARATSCMLPSRQDTCAPEPGAPASAEALVLRAGMRGHGGGTTLAGGREVADPGPIGRAGGSTLSVRVAAPPPPPAARSQ